MSKDDIRDAYRFHFTIGYDTAIALLMQLGFTEYAADRYLFARG